MSKNEKIKYSGVGGEALIEGIMMQGPGGAAVSVRTPDGTIDTDKVEFKHAKDEFKPLGLPFIRGLFNFCFAKAHHFVVAH